MCWGNQGFAGRDCFTHNLLGIPFVLHPTNCFKLFGLHFEWIVFHGVSFEDVGLTCNPMAPLNGGFWWVQCTSVYLLCFGPLCTRYFLIFVSCVCLVTTTKNKVRCWRRNSSSFGYCGGKVDLRARLKSISIWMCECRWVWEYYCSALKKIYYF